ncbi:MAG: cytochrome-c peroxidase [Bacteroidota bacterium]
MQDTTTMMLRFLSGAIICWMVFSCEAPEELTSYVPFPEDNPSTKEKIALGRALFFDKRLSKDGSVSCASCHRPEFAFTDRKPVAQGIGGQFAERNAPTLLNSAFLQTVMFDAHLKTLELQVIVPIQEPSEMGHNMKELIPTLRAIPEYQKAAKALFNRDFDAWVLTRSIAAFERSLLSLNSRYDQYMKGHKNAINEQEVAGMKLFNSLYCVQCHPAPYFTNFKAENNGLYATYGKDKGRFRINLDSADIGFFKTPTLRNIALTFPYMHDGTMTTLEQVIDHYVQGGKHPKGQSKFIESLTLTTVQKQQLMAFLGTLTDTSYMKKFRKNVR